MISSAVAKARTMVWVCISKRKRRKLPLGYCCRSVSHKQMVPEKWMQYKRKRANKTSSLACHSQHHSSLLAANSKELQGFAPGLGQVHGAFCTLLLLLTASSQWGGSVGDVKNKLNLLFLAHTVSERLAGCKAGLWKGLEEREIASGLLLGASAFIYFTLRQKRGWCFQMSFNSAAATNMPPSMKMGFRKLSGTKWRWFGF